MLVFVAVFFNCFKWNHSFGHLMFVKNFLRYFKLKIVLTQTMPSECYSFEFIFLMLSWHKLCLRSVILLILFSLCFTWNVKVLFRNHEHWQVKFPQPPWFLVQLKKTDKYITPCFTFICFTLFIYFIKVVPGMLKIKVWLLCKRY